MCSLFFKKDAFGKHFFELTDMAETKAFFKDSEYGLKVLSKKHKITNQFNKLRHQNKIERVATLFKIISLISTAETTPLSSFVYKKKIFGQRGKTHEQCI